jgi:hypothetical protein
MLSAPIAWRATSGSASSTSASRAAVLLPALPGMNEVDELRTSDGFFEMVFSEDAATLRTWA